MSSGVATRGRGRGRHSGLVGEEREEVDPVDRALGAWPTPRVSGAGDGRARVYIRGEETDPGGDTVVLGGLFHGPGVAPEQGSGPPAEPLAAGETERPRHRQHYRLVAFFIGISVLTVAGYLAGPPLLSAMGVGAQGSCQTCQFPIPSSQAIGAAPVPSSPAPSAARPARTASAPAPGPADPVSTPPSTAAASAPPPTARVSYTAVPAAGGLTGQVTVVNQGAAAISGWQLMVALPGDSVSAVQNAEFTDDNDVLLLSPAPYDLSIAPGVSVTVSIYASGPESMPAECSFNGVACR
jgi:hypothetical protein